MPLKDYRSQGSNAVFFLLLFGSFTWLLLSTGCNTGSSPVLFNTQHWEPGLEVWYRIEVTDSVLGPDNVTERKKSDKAIRFSIIDTTDGATIEWLELHLLERLDKDTASFEDQREWVPAYRIVYRCNRAGSIVSVLNYPEVKANADTLIAIYLDQINVGNDEDVQRFTSTLMDSTSLMTSLLRDADLLHRLFGFRLTKEDTLELFTVQVASDTMLQPYKLYLTNNAICGSGIPSLKGLGDLGNMNIGSFLTERFGQWAPIDSLKIPMATGQEEMTACFDTTRSLPTYLSFKRKMALGDQELVQRVLIFLQNEAVGSSEP